MTFAKKDAARGAAARFTPAAERLFLAKLAESANVTASAKAAGVTTSAVYRRRESSTDFCAGWQRALAEGYARLEAELLGQALARVNGLASDRTIRAQAMKHRLGLALLAAHRASVRGGAAAAASAPSGTARDRITAKLAQMHARLHPAGDDDGFDAPDGDVEAA